MLRGFVSRRRSQARYERDAQSLRSDRSAAAAADGADHRHDGQHTTSVPLAGSGMNCRSPFTKRKSWQQRRLLFWSW